MKKRHIPLLTIALSAFLVSISYANEQEPSNSIEASTVTDSPFADSFNTIDDESTQASTTGEDSAIKQAVTNSELSFDGNAQQNITGFNIVNSSGNSLVGSSSNINANESTTTFDDAMTANNISSDAVATATADVGTIDISQTSTLEQTYTQN